MKSFKIAFTLFACLLLFNSALAQNRYYHVYVDNDDNPSTGCTINIPNLGATITGAEQRLTVTTDSNLPPSITDTESHACQGNVFSAGNSVGDAALGLNTGVNGADVIELGISKAQLGINSSGNVLFYFATESNTAEDVVLINDNNGPIFLGFAFPVPTLGVFALLLLAILLLIISKKHLSTRLKVTAGMILIVSTAWAMTIIIDGQTSDWGGSFPVANDATGDTAGTGSFADFTAIYLTKNENDVFIRMDLVDVENQAPIANNSADSTDEEQSVIITLTGSDPEGAAITFATDTAPANGSLSNYTVVNNTTSTVQYTPDADFAGMDSFTIVADDGQVNSAPATVTVTVNPINDAPSFTSGGTVNVLKTAGPYSQTWASNISAGPADEIGQALTFNITNNDNPGIFTQAPSIDSNGLLTFTGVNNATGTANITVELMDDGGTANGGDDTSASVTFAVTLQGVNDEPSFTAGGNQSVLEDVGPQSIAAWATAISAGPADEAGQVLTFNITANDKAALFSAGPAVAADGTLSFTPAADANGTANITLELMDDGGTANGGDDTSPPQSFSISVTAVNDVPSFSAGPNDNVLENAPAQTINNWASSISAGPTDESGQTVSFNVSNDNNALFSAQPAINSDGDLTYTPTAGTLGSAQVDVTISDNGGVANGGVDTSAIQTFTISVTDVNDEPSFTAGPNETVNEDAAAVAVAWATAISPGPANEAGQNLTFNITANDNAALFSAGPAVAADGTLSYTTAADANGTANITLELMDDGGTANGGDDTSPTQTFSITINPVNDVPSFTSGGDVTVDEDSGSFDSTWATALTSGPTNESSQALSFNIVNVSNGTLFSAAPTVNATTGNLSFTPANGEFGTSTVTINLMDNGGTANGGVDTSANITFDITVSEVNEPPVLANIADPNVDENTLLAFTATATDPNVPAQNLTFSLGGTAPAGAAITAGGDFTWTPTETQGTTGSFTFDVVVTDDGTNPSNLTDTQSITVTVNKTNEAPVLTAIGAQSVDELTPLNFMATATDSDDPAQNLNFSLGGTVPAGATISAAGTFSWTPTEAQGPGVYNFDVIVTDDGANPANLTDTETISVTVNSVNTAPILTAIGNQAIDEETLLSFNAMATDSDLPAQTLAFSLSGAVPTGASISTGGAFTWTPTEAQGPGMYTFDVVVTDDGVNPANLSDSETITVTVNEVNAAPTANAQATTTDDATPINITLTGSDPEGASLTFAIDTAPAIGSLGAITQVTPTSADVTYTPSGVVGSGDFTFTVNDGALTSPAATVTLPVTSSNTAPTGVNDAYDVTGNVGIDVPAGSGVVSNDTDPEMDTLTVTAFDAVSAQGGTVSVNANGSFTYDPAAGFTGADSFGYTLSDGALTDTATVNLTVANKVWFIDNAAAAGDGRLNSPFNSISGFNSGATDTAGDVIHIDLGDGSSTGYDAGITLLASQKLIGQGVTLNSANTGFTFPTHTRALPAAATNPTLVRTNANSIVVGSNNTIRGLSVGNTGSGTGISGNGIGILTISNVSVSGTGKAVDLNNGTAAIVFDSISSSGSASQGIDLSNLTGSFTVNGGTIANSVQSSVLLTDVTNISFNNLTINNAQLHGIEGTNVTTLDLTGVTISGSGDALNENGIFLTNLRGSGGNTSNFHDVSILNTDGDNAILIHQTENATSGLLIDGDTLIEDAREGGIEVRTQLASATFNLIVGNTSALGVGDDVVIDNTISGVLAFAESGVINATVRNTLFQNGGGIASINRAGSGTNGVMFVGISGQSTSVGADINLTASGNDIQIENSGAGGSGSAGIALGGSGNTSGVINNNIVESNDEYVKGIFSNFAGIGNLATNTISIDNNTTNMTGSGGNETIVGIEYRASNSAGELSVTTTNNTVFSAGDNGFSGGIFALAGNTGVGHNNTLCSDIIGNDATAPNAIAVDGDDYGFVSFTGTVFQLENPVVGALSEAQIDNHIISNDAGISLATDVNVFNVGGAMNGVNSSCPQ